MQLCSLPEKKVSILRTGQGHLTAYTFSLSIVDYQQQLRFRCCYASAVSFKFVYFKKYLFRCFSANSSIKSQIQMWYLSITEIRKQLLQLTKMKFFVVALLIICIILVFHDGYVHFSGDVSLSITPSFLQGIYYISLSHSLLFFSD